jgi:hypothetical protein
MAVQNSNATLFPLRPARFLACIILVLLSACSPSEPKVIEAGEQIEATLFISQAEASQLTDALWKQSLTAIQSILSQAQQLNAEVAVFLNAPSAEGLKAVQQEWRKTFSDYQKFLPFLYISNGGVEDDENTIKHLEEWRFLLAAWPIMPAYIDTYGIYIHSGIVNDIALAMTEKNLRKQHGLTDREEVVLGLHAMEFLLWANQKNDAYKRFAINTLVPPALKNAGLKQEELPNNRRRQLLKLQSQIFLNDVETLASNWQQGGLLSRKFQALSTREKALSLHNSLQSCIENLKQLLLHHGNERGEDLLHYNAFAGERKKAFAELISAIEEIYFQGQPALANALLSTTQNEKLKQLLSQTLTLLKNGEASSISSTVNIFNELLVLLEMPLNKKS